MVITKEKLRELASKITPKKPGRLTSNKVKITVKKMNPKRILKTGQVTVTIKEHKPAEYVSRFFKDEVEEAKKAMFFK